MSTTKFNLLTGLSIALGIKISIYVAASIIAALILYLICKKAKSDQTKSTAYTIMCAVTSLLFFVLFGLIGFVVAWIIGLVIIMIASIVTSNNKPITGKEVEVHQFKESCNRIKEAQYRTI